MPRRQFQADLQKAVAGVSIAGISDVEVGNDDGEFIFTCAADGQQLKISVLIPELSDYPSSHMCMIYGADSASASVATALDNITSAANGKTILQILELVSTALESTDNDGDQQMLNSQDFGDFEDDSDEGYEDEYFPGDEDMNSHPVYVRTLPTSSGAGHTDVSSAFLQRIRHDLLIAKSEGFRVGYQGGLMTGLGCYVSLSIRIAKLGISEEAMQAWQLQSSEYLVAILHYPHGYKSVDDIKSYDPATARRSFAIRVGISTTYKPSIQEAVAAFTVLSREEEKRRASSQQTDSQQTYTNPKGFRNSFISRPLNELLEHRFHLLLKYRYGGMPWHGAESLYNDQVLISSTSKQDASDDKYYDDEPVSNAWPEIVTNDHITSFAGHDHSLPLVAMQFVLRHFVRCTEFCLICFSRMPDDLQAIKPYVCDNPLCLYQYMSLGFGPSIEHEILSQPKVVDLLISFCYVSARFGRLRDFPSGLSLSVPPPVAYEADYTTFTQNSIYQPPSQQPTTPVKLPISVKATTVRYNARTHELLFDNARQTCPLATGQWIVLRTDATPDAPLHCRVIDATYYPSVRMSEPIMPAKGSNPNDSNARNVWRPQQQPQPPVMSAPGSASDEFQSASFYVYYQNFDDLTADCKRKAIAALLDMLPSVRDMQQYLSKKAHSSLSAWVDRLSPAALGILRWIIASNRACIVQVDSEDEHTQGRKGEDRLYGMAGFAQFRFAMGAPDKERRFIHSVRVVTERLGLKYPTLFAWHGSPLQNWHSIIREGLHFNETLHGRAYGNGVYHAPDVSTSLGYSSFGHQTLHWPLSELKVQQALALNEIVNAPQEYVSQQPHYVVAQLDWIQTRYLFVKTNAPLDPQRTEAKPLECLEQDPKRTPRGVGGALIIPIHAIAASRRNKPNTPSRSSTKRLKATGKTQYDPIEIDGDGGDDDAASVTTLEEDRAIFEPDEVDHSQPQYGADPLPTPNSITGNKGKSKMASLVSFGSKLLNSKAASQPKSLTDYVPGMLDYSTLPMLQMPAWAETPATRRLMKEFKEVIRIQNNEPLHELGWHIDEDRIDNMYQWIVELHSFDAALPLAQDMKKHKIKSVVLEMRFGKDYPMSPPFVRVIRPRFLGFQQGGGGHVTAGGAMCMQLLTNDGWSAASSIESVLLQVRMAISSTDPKPARLAHGGMYDYGVGEAVDAYVRACQVHGWTVPPGFKELAYGGGSAQNGSGAPF